MRQILNKIIFYLILLVFLLPFNPAFADPYTLFLATFVDSFPVEEQETFPQGLAFSSDGTKMFFTGAFGPDVNEYTLANAFDVSTASFVDSFSVSAQGFVPYGLAFSSDGAKMFVVNDSGSDAADNVNEYTLTNAFDVSTASFVDSFSVVEQENAPKGLAFSSDGTKMFVVGDGSNPFIHEYTLTTGFDVSTASFVDSFSVVEQETKPQDLAFTDDGTKMFFTGSGSNAVIHEYTLTNAYDVSTASFVDTFSVLAQGSAPKGLAFSSDETKLFIVDSFNDVVNEYNFSSCFPPSSGNWVVDTSCTMPSSPSNPTINNGDLIVQNNSVLTIPSGVSLDIDFANFNLTVESGSGVLIKAGGAIT